MRLILWTLIIHLLFIQQYLCIEIVPVKSEDAISKYLQPLKRLPSPTLACPVPCFYSTEEKHAIECSSNGTKLSTIPYNITCLMSNNGHIVIGKKEGVKRIIPGTLVHFMDLVHQKVANFGSRIMLQLKFNLMELSANTFVGITSRITELSIFNVYKMHPDALIDLNHLTFLEFQSMQPPVLMLDDQIRSFSIYGIDNNASEKDLPSFIRLILFDNTIPIGFNLPVYCHICPMTDSKHYYVIIVFRSFIKNHSQKGISILYPSSCPKKINGLGCPKDLNLTELQESKANFSESAFIPNENDDYDLSSEDPLHDVYKDWSMVDRIRADNAKRFSKLRFTLIFLTLWCALITILVLFIMFFVCMRKKRIVYKRADNPVQRKNLSVTANRNCFHRFYHRMSWLSSTADDECRSVSTSSGFFTPSNQVGDSRNSWNSVRNPGANHGRSNSVTGMQHPPSPGYKPRIKPNGTPIQRRSRQENFGYSGGSNSQINNSRTRLYPSNTRLDKSVPLIDNLLLSNGNYQLPPIPPHQGQKSRLNIIEQV